MKHYDKRKYKLLFESRRKPGKTKRYSHDWVLKADEKYSNIYDRLRALKRARSSCHFFIVFDIIVFIAFLFVPFSFAGTQTGLVLSVIFTVIALYNVIQNIKYHKRNIKLIDEKTKGLKMYIN